MSNHSWLAALGLLVGLSLPAPTLAQAPSANKTPDAPSFNSIRTPTSPAFTLLGVEPSSVERPNSPSSLAVSVLGAVGEADTVPENFALEFSPYWLIGHPTLRWQDDDQRSVPESIIRTATFSVATGAVGTKAAPSTGLSIGGRASLWSGRLSESTRTQLGALSGLLAAESALGLKLMAAQLAALTEELKAKTITVEEFKQRVNELTVSTVTAKTFLESPERKAVEKAMQKFASNREGFFLEVAGAAGWGYPDGIWSQGEFNRWGFWATPSYQDGRKSLVGVLRYFSRDRDAENGLFDVGLRGIHSGDRYGMSVEAVRRVFRDSDLEARYRLVGVIEYEAWEGGWLVASFGRDHNTADEGSLVARLGLSFNFSKDRYVSDPAPVK